MGSGIAGVGVAPDNATATKLTLTADVAGDKKAGTTITANNEFHAGDLAATEPADVFAVTGDAFFPSFTGSFVGCAFVAPDKVQADYLPAAADSWTSAALAAGLRPRPWANSCRLKAASARST